MRESMKVFRKYDDKHGCVYTKATHLQKKLWIPFLNMCLKNANHPFVICFCHRVLVTLSSMLDDDWYTVLYCGETIQTFGKRMADKDPRWFLDWFPATHIFRIAVFMYTGLLSPLKKILLSGATRTIEAENAAWLSHKLPGLEYCHSYNIVHCGRRIFLLSRGDFHLRFNYMFVSFEMIKGACMCAICLLNMFLY